MLTKEQFVKLMNPPPKGLIDAAQMVVQAKAMVATIKPIVEGYQREILERHQFHIAKKWRGHGMLDRIILDPNESYLLEQEDFSVYLDECKEARIAAGLHVDDEEKCPLLVAQSVERDAIKVLCDIMEPITGISHKNIVCSKDGIKKLHEYVDITLRLLVPYLKS